MKNWFWKVTAFPIGLSIYLMTKLLELSLRIEVRGKQFPGPAIYVHWHQNIPHLISEHGRYHRSMLVSAAPYMASIARWCILSGLRLIRGGSGESGEAALDLMRQAIAKGNSVVIAVDGPRGPIFQLKRGCVELAKQTGVPIIAVGYSCEKGQINHRRWDLSLRARLFDRLTIRYGSPVFLGPDAVTEEALIGVKDELERIRLSDSKELS